MSSLVLLPALLPEPKQPKLLTQCPLSHNPNAVPGVARRHDQQSTTLFEHCVCLQWAGGAESSRTEPLPSHALAFATAVCRLAGR